jgi:hypothetical protein
VVLDDVLGLLNGDPKLTSGLLIAFPFTVQACCTGYGVG